MKLKDIIRPPRNEQGVALLIALAVLVLMAILAVSFYSSQDLEGQAATNAYYARSAQAAAQGGLEWAIALIESDMDPTTGVVLGYDTDFDVWGPRAHETGNWSADVLFIDGTRTDVHFSDLPNVEDSRWIDVERPLPGPGAHSRIVGRFAAIIHCENGKANVNVLGTENDLAEANNTGDGISPAEVSLHAILGAVPDGNASWADAIISERNGTTGPVGGGDTDGDGPLGYLLCDDDLDGTPDPADATDAIGEPDQRNMYNMLGDAIAYLDLSTVRLDSTMTAADLSNIRDYVTVNSLTQNVYKVKPEDNNDTEWRLQVPINTATADAIYDALQSLGVGPPDGRLPALTPEILDQIAANIADFVDDDNEPTQRGARYGIEKTPYLNEVEARPPEIKRGPLMYTEYGEFIELINPYEGDGSPVTVTVMDVPQLGGVPQDITVSVPAASGDTPGYYVIGDTSGIWVHTLSGDSGPATGLPKLPAIADQGENLNLPNTGPLKLRKLTLVLGPAGGPTIEVASYEPESTPGPETTQKDDPRVDERETHNGTPKAQNVNWAPDASGDMDSGLTLAERFVVYDGKLGSVGHLGRVHAGQKWATIDLTGDDLGGNWDDVHKRESWLNIYEVFTTEETVPNARYGLININTAPEEVLVGLKGVDSTVARGIAEHATGPDDCFETIGELGYFLGIEPQGTATTWVREKHLADIAGLVTVRSHVFRVTLLAQAVDRQGNMVGESKLEASVLRTIDVSTGKPSVRVLSTRWIFEE